MIKQSVCFGPFTGVGAVPEELIKQSAAIDYASVEMAPRAYWPLIKDSGLDIAISIGRDSLADGLNKRSNHDRIEDELLAHIDEAAAHKIPALIVFSGNCEGKTSEEGLANCVEGLLRVVPAAEQRGVTLCMELLNSKVNHPDYQCDRTSWSVALCRAVGSPAVKLLYDIYHMQIMEGDIIRTIGEHAKYIGHYHTAGNPGRSDLDEMQELFYPAIMRAIHSTEYSGYVGHEFRPKSDPLQALQTTYNLRTI